MNKTAVIVGNLGTPESPAVSDVRNYLKQFLMDAYVIDKPFWFRWLLVNAIIVPLRAHKSAEAYASIWQKEGSPLKFLSERLVRKLQNQLGDAYKVVLGMRYGKPSLHSTLASVKDCSKIVLFPQYPQFADSSYTSWMDEAMAAVKELGLEEKIITIPPFYNRSEYLSAMAQKITKDLEGKKFDRLLMSYHGLPERHVQKLDTSGEHCIKKANCCDKIIDCNKNCYRAQCYYVSREIAKLTGIKNYQVSFQSRLGRDPWIHPFTDVVLKDLPKQGVKNLAVVMPAFTVDCLETLEEVQMRAKEDFLAAGGQSFYALPCLNEDEFWIQQLSLMVEKSLLVK